MRSDKRLVGGKVVAAVDVATTEAQVEAPAKSASREDWDAYATAQGLDPAEFSNKDDLIKAVTK